MSKRVFVHVGRAKTGSTALQYALSDGRAALERHGFAYPSHHYPDHAFIVYVCNPGMLKSFAPAQQGTITSVAESVRAELAGIERDVILSSEGLSNTNPEVLARWLGPLDIWIVMYIREQVEWLASGYQQEVKARMVTSRFPEYARQFVGTSYCGELLDKWAAVFGRERIIARVYDKELLVGKNIITDFLSVIGIEDPAPFLANPRPDGNPSIMGALLEAKRRINELGFDECQLLQATYKALLDLANENSAYRGPVGADSGLVEEIREKCRSSNADVAQRYFGRTELFPLRPFPPETTPDESQVRSVTEAILERVRRNAPEFARELSARLEARNPST